MSRVLAVCGMPGSGKGEFAQIFIDAGIPVRSMGDMVREEVARRELDVIPEVFGKVASDLRREFGEDVLAVRLTAAVDELLETHPLVLIDGLRGTAEYSVFKSTWGDKFQSVAIHTDKEIRFARMMARGRSEDGGTATFEARDEREKGWGLEDLIDSADVLIENNEDLTQFQNQIRTWLATLI
ncbi:MAG: AAA family ATPase [Candidatus Poseidoniaceae archaeon]|nr:AAA family ATPase [Candidatus Poseidoniaceae archaeon]